jgi:hypothetical protein
MNLGDTVFQNYGGLHRYGKVTEVKENFKGDGWSWFKIDWVNDEKFINCQRWKANLRAKSPVEFIPEYYRADDIASVDIKSTVETLLKLQNNAE